MFELGDIVSRYLNNKGDLEYGICVSNIFQIQEPTWKDEKYAKSICVIWANGKNELDTYTNISNLTLISAWDELTAILYTDQHCIDWYYKVSSKFDPSNIK